MQNNRDIPHLQFITLLWLAVTAIALAFSLVAYFEHDGHWVNRGGALIAALAAGAVVLQIAIEIGIERSKHSLDSRSHGEVVEVESMLPLDRIAHKLREARLHAALKGLERKRLSIALRVVVCAMLGELMHGFGDILACHTFVICSRH